MAARTDLLGKGLASLVSIATIIGIPSGLYGYFSSQHDKRVEKTFEFYRHFRSDSMQNHWSVLIGRASLKASEMQHYTQAKDDLGLRQLAASLVVDDAGAKAFNQMIAFFDEFIACVDNSLCDSNAGVALLSEPAYQFVGAYGPHIISIRDKFGTKVKNATKDKDGPKEKDVSKRFGSGAYKASEMKHRFQLF